MHTGATQMTSVIKAKAVKSVILWKSKLHTTNARVKFITTITQQSDHRHHHRNTKINVATAEKAPSFTPSNWKFTVKSEADFLYSTPCIYIVLQPQIPRPVLCFNRLIYAFNQLFTQVRVRQQHTQWANRVQQALLHRFNNWKVQLHLIFTHSSRLGPNATQVHEVNNDTRGYTAQPYMRSPPSADVIGRSLLNLAQHRLWLAFFLFIYTCKYV